MAQVPYSKVQNSADSAEAVQKLPEKKDPIDEVRSLLSNECSFCWVGGTATKGVNQFKRWIIQKLKSAKQIIELFTLS
jgi:hypothetical protein